MKIVYKTGKTFVNLKDNADIIVEYSQPLDDNTRFDYDRDGVLVRIVYEGTASLVNENPNVRLGVLDL